MIKKKKKPFPIKKHQINGNNTKQNWVYCGNRQKKGGLYGSALCSLFAKNYSWFAPSS